MRALIADDEELARERLTAMLRGESIDVVAVCSSGDEAVAAIEATRPDVAFLDIEMPVLSGFEVVDALDDRNRPAIVFVTAFDEYAVRAFDVHAVDYLLKPVSRSRLRDAVDHSLHVSPQALSDAARSLGGRAALMRIAVRDAGRLIVIDVDDIEVFEGAGNYVRLHGGGGRWLYRQTLANLEARLDPSTFARVSRSAIVNLRRVREIRPQSHGDRLLVMAGGVEVKMSRTCRAVLDRIAG